MKNLIKVLKTEEFKKSVKKTSNELLNGLIGVGFSVAIIGSLYVGISYLDSKSNTKQETYKNQFLDKEGNCIKYVPRAGYFYCKTNKPFK